MQPTSNNLIYWKIETIFTRKWIEDEIIGKYAVIRTTIYQLICYLEMYRLKYKNNTFKLIVGLNLFFTLRDLDCS